MTDPYAALRQLIAAAEPVSAYGRWGSRDVEQGALQAAIAAARAALEAQPGAVAWAHPDGRVIPAATYNSLQDEGAPKSSIAGYTIPLYAAPPQRQPLTQTYAQWRESLTTEQTHDFDSEGRGYKKDSSVLMRMAWEAGKAAAAPPQRAPLSEEDLLECADKAGVPDEGENINNLDLFAFARAVERAHGII